MKKTAQQIAESLTKEQIVYLYIADSLWGGTDVFAEDVIEDVKDTGGEFGSNNWVSLDYCEGDFDNKHVVDVINTWRSLCYEYDTDYGHSSLEVLDTLMGEGSALDNFTCVTFNVAGETGSYAWTPRSDDSIEIIEILNEAHTEDIVREFLSA